MASARYARCRGGDGAAGVGDGLTARCCPDPSQFYRLADTFFKQITNSLAKMKPQNYVCHAWLPEERILVGTDTGVRARRARAA